MHPSLDFFSKITVFQRAVKEEPPYEMNSSSLKLLGWVFAHTGNFAVV
jgi:hypothetical protein